MEQLIPKKELAKRTFRTVRMIDYILSGKQRPSRKLCEKLAEITGVPKESWMWPGEPWPNPYIK